MKKIYYLIGAVLIYLLVTSCVVLNRQEKQPSKNRAVEIKIGAPNAGGGDNLYTAFTKVNQNFAAHDDSVAVMRDSIVILRALANSAQSQLYDTVLLSTVGFVKADTATKLATKTDLLNIEGGGAGGGFYYLKGIIDVTDGLPADGDSIITHTSFIGKHIEFWRAGDYQYKHTDNTEYDGYRFNNVTGTLITRPVLAANEEIQIWSTNTILFTPLIAEGGTPPSLLTDLVGFWQFNETSGSAFADVLGLNDATTYGTALNQSGKFGVSFRNDTRSDYTVVANDASLYPSDDELTISMWFKLDTLPSVTGKNSFLIRFYDVANIWSYEAFIKYPENYITFYLYNEADAPFQAETANNAVSINTWYNLILELAGVGTQPKIYLNGSNVTDYNYGGNFTGTIDAPDRNLYFGNTNNEGTWAAMGNFDAIGIWHRTLTAGEKTILQTFTYPFQ